MWARYVAGALALLCFSAAALDAALPGGGSGATNPAPTSPDSVPFRGLTRGFFHPAMADVIGLSDEQRQSMSLMLLWFLGMAMDIAQSTGNLEDAAPALTMLELLMEDLIASVLTSDQLASWDQLFATAKGNPGSPLPSRP